MDMSISLMLHGMGVVFGFLILAIFLISAMSKIVHLYFRPNVADTPSTDTASITQAPSTIDPKIVQIIQEALNQHRHRKR